MILHLLAVTTGETLNPSGLQYPLLQVGEIKPTHGVFQKLYFKCKKWIKFYTLIFLPHLEPSRQGKSAGLGEEIGQCVTSISEEWRSDLLVTVPQKLRKKKAAKRSIIHVKNRVTVGVSPLKIVRWCYYTCQSNVAEAAQDSSSWQLPSPGLALHLTPRACGTGIVRIDFCCLSAPNCSTLLR